MATPVDVRCAIPATRGVKAGTFIGGKLAGAAAADLHLASGAMSGGSASALTGAVVMADGVASGALSATAGAPAWMSGAVVNAWTPMPNSTGAGGSGVDAFCDFAIDDELTLWIAAAGGHGVSDNRVVKYDASADTPTGWELVIAASPSHTANVAYEPDGKPSARHTYNYTVFGDTDGRRVYLIGSYGTDPDAWAWNVIDAVDIDAEAWDAAGTHPYTYGSSLLGAAYTNGVVKDESSGAIFWNNNGTNIRRWTPGSAPVDLGAVFPMGRFPTCFDSVRTAFFNLQYGDGQGFNPELGLTARQTLTPSGTPTARSITFNSSAALSQLLADAPINYAGMHHDSLRDRFLFVYGAAGQPKLIEITPNSGTVWDMVARTPTGTVGNIGSAGIQGRVKFVERGGIGGFLILPSAAAGLYFLRTI